MNAPLSPADAVKVLRNRYPDVLVCVTCATLLATRRENYRLTEEQRLAYVCAECRREAAEAASTAASRAEAARLNLIKANAAKAARKALQATDGYLVESAGNEPSLTRMNSGDERVVSMTVERQRRGTTTRRGGRPVKHVSERERKQAAREAARQYRANRRKQQTTPVPA